MDVDAKNTCLRCYFGDDRAAVAPATWTVVFYDDNPLTVGVELTTGGGYAPKAVANTTANWPVPDGGAIVSTPLDYGTSTGAWSDTAAYLGLKDELGNLWYSRTLAVPIVVTESGQVVPPLRVVVTQNAEDEA